MYVTVILPGYRQALSFVAAVAQVAAALRTGQPVTVAATNNPQPTRWALTTGHGNVVAEPVNPDLFDLDTTPPAWVRQLAAAAAALL